MSRPARDFDPRRYEEPLSALIGDLLAAADGDARALTRAQKRYPKGGGATFSKSEIARAFRDFAPARGWAQQSARFERRLRAKPVRTASGVAPLTVLTKPYPCPGRCVFCPDDPTMPKSYLANEPGAQRAARHGFDPARQTTARLRSFRDNGHPTDKIELIVLGGTWSSYPEDYRSAFVRRCFEALNAFPSEPPPEGAGADLAAVHRANESAGARCVGLSVETRPDHATEAEVLHVRRLGATKVQLGVQSLDDAILEQNRRGHDVAATRAAFARLRAAGFKVQAHWMPNLVGATPRSDARDFERLFEDPGFRPDELKIYPCSLIASAGLGGLHAAGAWRPYAAGELVELLVHCVARVPRWCRVTRVIRDIPGTDIVAGNRTTNLRQVVLAELARRGVAPADIWSRELRDAGFEPSALELRETRYRGPVGEECFLELVDPGDRLVAFLRLSLPDRASFVRELGRHAVIREVHVYGTAVALGQRDAEQAQHRGYGTRLVERAAEIAAAAGYARLAVISAVGTRGWYRRLGFEDGPLYQGRALAPRC